MVDETFPVEADDVLAAKDVVLATRGLSARDAVHVAVMKRRDVATIMSFDRGFDGYPGIHRHS
jgi:predicted nucleic acid-binding protein